jgi:hypothetical protein
VPRSVWAQLTVLSIVHVITSHVITFNAIGVSGHRYWACGLACRWWRQCGSPCTYRCRCWCRYGCGGTMYRRRVIWVTATATVISPSSGVALPIGGVLGVLAMLGDRVRSTWGVPAGVFGGGGHLFGCHHWRWRRCCLAAVGMGTTMINRCLWHVLVFCWRVSLVGGGGGGCLPGSCLSVASTFLPPPPSFSFPPFFPLPTPSFPSPSFGCVSSGCGTRHSCSREVDGGGLVGPTVTGRL